VNQQRRRRQTTPGIVERSSFMRGGRNNVGDEMAQSVQHQSSTKMFEVYLASRWHLSLKYGSRIKRAQSIVVPHAHYDSAICRRWREIHHGIS
jgi:hypothetical protein